MRRCVAAILSAGALAGLPATGAFGDADPRLRMVDQLYEDTDLLRTSLRVLNHEMRQPQGFSQLYEDTANPGTYVRVSGAIYQVSKNTKYIHTEDATYVGIASGTVFYIGGMPDPPAWERQSSPSNGVVHARALPLRRPTHAESVVTAQLAAPSALRAIDVEDAQRLSGAAHALTLDPSRTEASPDDIGVEWTRADRLRAITQRIVQGE